MSEPERHAVGGLRTIGDDQREQDAAAPAPASEEDQTRALELLKAEFARAFEMKEKLKAEAAIGGKEKDRDAKRMSERHRGIIASLEGMSRFALKMGLITPAQNRELFADAMKRGLYEGWTEGA